MKLHERLHEMQKRLAEGLGEEHPVSLARIAQKAGLSTSALTRIERNSRELNKEGGEKALRLCAEAWDYSVDWLVTGRGDPQQKPLGPFDQAIAAEAWDPIAKAAATAARDEGIGRDWSAVRWQTYLRGFHNLARQTEKAPASSVATGAAREKIKKS